MLVSQNDSGMRIQVGPHITAGHRAGHRSYGCEQKKDLRKKPQI